MCSEARRSSRTQGHQKPARDRKADQPSCRPYQVTQTLIATADQMIE
jgi:hypothetical protein